MHRKLKWIAPVVALGLMAGLSAMTARAAEDSGKGSITGTVTGTDGKPAADVAVRVVKPHAKGEKPAAGEKPVPVASGTTDQDGKFKIEGVPAGDYVVVAGSKSAGMGHEKVSVTDGASAEVSITLKAAGGKHGEKGGKHGKKHGAEASGSSEQK